MKVIHAGDQAIMRVTLSHIGSHGNDGHLRNLLFGNSSITGVTLRPGFHPPAGNASSLEVGGVTTQNIFVDSTGISSGRDYGKSVRTVAVKAGDRIQVEVAPQRAGIDNFSETGGREVTGFLKYYLGGGNVARLLGGIELDYGTKEKDLLPHFPPDDLPTIVVSPDIPVGDIAGLNPARQALRWKEPFLLATFQEKTERDSRFPSRSWIDNSPGGFYASEGIDQDEDFANHQYEFKWEAMTDWPPNSPTIEISNEGNRGYGGAGIYAQSGTEFATFASLPLGPAHSLAQLRHAPLNVGGQLPLTTQIIANSFAPPLLGENRVRAVAGSRTYLDHSYLANNALFDSWFLSSAADHPALPGTAARSAGDLLAGFFVDGKALPNGRFSPHTGGENPARLAAHLKSSADSYREIAAHMMIDAPFNVNSTRVAAWQALLASNFGAPAPLIAAGALQLHNGRNLPVLRHSHVTAGDFETASGTQPSDNAKWNGYRRLNQDQLARLAAAIVEEVKKRGPFQSLAEFVNRRPGGGELSRNGALQAALENAAINDNVLDASHLLPGGGNTADGAPGVINQADVLTPLAPQLVARGDTFRIRAYGEAADGTASKVRAWCEAVVQRVPEFIDSSTDSSTATPTANITQPVSLPVTAGKAVILRGSGDPANPAASLIIHDDIDKALVVLMPTAVGSSEPYRAFAIDFGHARFPLGTYQLVNVSTHPVRGAIGRSFAEVKPGAIAGLELQGEPGTTQGVRFEFMADGKWNRLTETRCAVRRDRRWLVCVYQDPATRRMNLRSIPDRTSVAAANTATATDNPAAATASR